MYSSRTEIPEVVLVQPNIIHDETGRNYTSRQQARLHDLMSVSATFVESRTFHLVAFGLQGLHYQPAAPQGHFVSCVRGKIWVVAADMRNGSPTLGRSVGTPLNDDACFSLWMPPGFALGFAAFGLPSSVVVESTVQSTDRYLRRIRYNDPDIGASWPLGQGRQPILSSEDRKAGPFHEAKKVSL